jgi:hypothetical protein
MIKSSEDADEWIQEAFLKLWMQRPVEVCKRCFKLNRTFFFVEKLLNKP